MAYTDLSSYVSARDTYWPGTYYGSGAADCTITADSITMYSRARTYGSDDVPLISGALGVINGNIPSGSSVDYYYPACIWQTTAADYSQVDNIKINFNRSGTIPRIVLIFTNKIPEFQSIQDGALLDHYSDSVIDMLNRKVQKDATFGYRAVVCKLMTFMSEDYSATGCYCDFNIKNNYMKIRTDLIDDQIYNLVNYPAAFQTAINGAYVDMTNAYMGIFIAGCTGSSDAAKIIITSIEGSTSPSYLAPSEDDGTKYLISNKSLTLMGNALREKTGRDTTYTPEQMVQEILRLNARGAMYYAPGDEPRTSAERLYLLRQGGTRYVDWCAQTSGGWHINEAGWAPLSAGRYQFTPEGSIELLSLHTSATQSGKKGTSWPTVMTTENTFNLKSLLAAGFKKLILKMDLESHPSEVSGNEYFQSIYTQFFKIIFAPTIGEKNLNLAAAYPDGYKEYYLRYSPGDTNCDFSTSSAYFVRESEDTYSLTLNDSLINAMGDAAAHIALGIIIDPIYYNPSLSTTRGYYDAIKELYFTKQ